jgi:hypothetical protein
MEISYRFALIPSSTSRRIASGRDKSGSLCLEVQMAQANSHSTIVPLYTLVRDWKLRRIFWQAGGNLGNEFAVPIVPQTGLNGGAAISRTGGGVIMKRSAQQDVDQAFADLGHA